MTEKARKSKEKSTAPILKVMKQVGYISKDRDARDYKFRGIDDVYNALHEPMAEAGIFTTSDILEEERGQGVYKRGGKYTKVKLRVKYNFHAKDGSTISTTVQGEGDDMGDKAGNKAMAVAHKYALLQMFMIPTEDAKDSEDPTLDATQQGEEPKEAPRLQGQHDRSRAPADVSPGGQNAAWSKKYTDAGMKKLDEATSLGDVLSVAALIKKDLRKLATADVDRLRAEIMARTKEFKEAAPAA